LWRSGISDTFLASDNMTVPVADELEGSLTSQKHLRDAELIQQVKDGEGSSPGRVNDSRTDGGVFLHTPFFFIYIFPMSATTELMSCKDSGLDALLPYLASYITVGCSRYMVIYPGIVN
jgi:hypothetical protein